MMSASGPRRSSSLSTWRRYMNGSTPQARHVSIRLQLIALAFAPATVSENSHDFLLCGYPHSRKYAEFGNKRSFTSQLDISPVGKPNANPARQAAFKKNLIQEVQAVLPPDVRIDQDNILVSLTLAQKDVPVPIALRLYLPKDWTQDKARRAEAKVPESNSFEAKGDIALTQVDAILAHGVRFGMVLADAAYGSSADFRAGLTQRG